MKRIYTFIVLLLLVLTSCNTQRMTTKANVKESYFINHLFDNQVFFTDAPDFHAYIISYIGYDSLEHQELRFAERKFFCKVDSVARNGKTVYSSFNGDKMVTTLRKKVETISIPEAKRRGYKF